MLHGELKLVRDWSPTGIKVHQSEDQKEYSRRYYLLRGKKRRQERREKAKQK